MGKKNKNTTYSFPEFKPCHNPTMVYKNLWACNEEQVYNLVAKERIDVLYPLASLYGEIWDYSYDVEIKLYPIRDYSILPFPVLDRLIESILADLETNKKVCVFCNGGHGRTGYIVSCVLGKLGITDPIEYLRTVYCKNAVESIGQIKSIANYIGNQELITKYSKIEYEDAYHQNLIQYYKEAFGINISPKELEEIDELL